MNNKIKIEDVDFSNLAFGKIFTDHMTVCKYADGRWGEVKLTDYGPIELLPSISALHYGQAVFEGMKVFAGQNDKANVFRMDSHFSRLNKSLERLAMPALPKEIFDESLKSLIAADREWLRRAGQLYLRPFVFATTPYLGMAPSDEYLFMVVACPVGAYYKKPLNLKVETEYSRSASGGVGFAKAAGNYAASLYPTKLAQASGADQVIWTDSATHKKVEESGTMNIVCVIDGKIITPKTSETILSGITRDSFLTLARQNNLEVEEKDLLVEELISAIESGTLTELFGVGTAVTVINVESVTYQDKKYTLPLTNENSISTVFCKKLEQIKFGQEKDLNNWITEI